MGVFILTEYTLQTEEHINHRHNSVKLTPLSQINYLQKAEKAIYSNMSFLE